MRYLFFVVVAIALLAFCAILYKSLKNSRWSANFAKGLTEEKTYDPTVPEQIQDVKDKKEQLEDEQVRNEAEIIALDEENKEIEDLTK